MTIASQRRRLWVAFGDCGAGSAEQKPLAQRAFASVEERAWLEGQVWPLVAARVQEWLAQAREMRPAPAAAVVEVPLLFEAGLDELYDATIAVVAEESVRQLRADARGHALIDERVARQLPQEEKARRATFVVHNDGSEDDLRRELSAVLAKL